MTPEQLVTQHQRKVIKHESLSLYPIEKGLFDIFEGSEWARHSRYRKHQGKWYYVGGNRLDNSRLPT